ncbi:MAG: hypothetical protein M0P74_01000 [Syntrophales bacterium]|jgi:hypothetical protein|nr:hypothetical protein [Syntrophales bacterium]
MDKDIKTEIEETEFLTEMELKEMQKELLEIPGYYDCYPFTHRQAYDIKDLLLLNKFEPAQVMRFIVELRDCCEGAACLLDQPDYRTYKNDRKSMVTLLEKSYALLNEINEGRLIRQLSSFSAFDVHNPEYGECQELAVTAGNLLSILIKKIKRLDDSMGQRFKGRPTADSKGIVAEIAKTWERCFYKKPTKYLEGLFVDVVKIALEGLNLKYEYPKRKIHAALKKEVTKLE